MNKFTISEIELKKPSQKDFEVHKKHNDIFFCVKGIVKIQILDKLFYSPSEYNEEKDFSIAIQLQGIVPFNIILNEGESITIKAGIPHKPNLIVDETIQKATVGIIKEVVE